MQNVRERVRGVARSDQSVLTSVDGRGGILGRVALCDAGDAGKRSAGTGVAVAVQGGGPI